LSRARCDWFDVSAIRSAIERGETNERAAYLEYAASAARPFARSTFSAMLRRTEPAKLNAEPVAEPLPTCAEIAERWRERIGVKPRILSLGPGGGLRVQKGALKVFDGATVLTYTRAGKPPSAIVLSTAGGFVSIEAVRFCARARCAIVALDRAHGFLSVMTPAPRPSAALIRAQCAADPLSIARAIVAAKIEAMRHAGALKVHENYMSALGRAATLDQIRIIEAQAARRAWPDPPLMKWERGPIPPDLAAPWLMRARLDAKGKREARHPVNAMMNAAFAVTAGRLAAYLAASGFAPAIGYLHADKRGRWSLTWDCIEPLRPVIERRLFTMIEHERFAVSDFRRAADGSLRLAPALLAMVLNEAAPPHAALAQCVRWLARLVLRAADGSISDSVEKRLDEIGRHGSAVGDGGLEGGDLAILRVGSRRQRGEHSGRILLKPGEL
jgi:CRISPR-associated endonuclease Cas1